MQEKNAEKRKIGTDNETMCSNTPLCVSGKVIDRNERSYSTGIWYRSNGAIRGIQMVHGVS